MKETEDIKENTSDSTFQREYSREWEMQVLTGAKKQAK